MDLIQMLEGMRGLRGGLKGTQPADPAEFNAWVQAAAQKLYQDLVAGGAPEHWARRDAGDFVQREIGKWRAETKAWADELTAAGAARRAEGQNAVHALPAVLGAVTVLVLLLALFKE